MKASKIALASALAGSVAMSAVGADGSGTEARVQIREVLRRGQGRQKRLPDEHALLRRNGEAGCGAGFLGLRTLWHL